MPKNFTQQQYQQAKSISLINYLQSQGQQFKKEGNRYRHKEHDSLLINENNKWFWNSRNLYGNNAISYLRLVYKMTLPEAVNTLTGDDIITNTYSNHEKAASEKQPFVLPEKNANYRRAFAYLNKTRGIDAEIISEMMKQHRIFESKDYRNCCFIGFDENEEPKHAAMWGTYTPEGRQPFKGEVKSSDKTCGFVMPGTRDTLYIFESPVDALSHATLYKMNSIDWRLDYRLSLCCTWDGALERFLKSNEIHRITFCLDDDKGGNTASKNYMKKYLDLGYEVHREKPLANDFNDELLETLALEKQNTEDMELDI